jgi:hypothetical protein
VLHAAAVLVSAPVQRAEAEVAVGRRGAHAECGAESESLVVIARGVPGVGGDRGGRQSQPFVARIPDLLARRIEDVFFSSGIIE